MTTFVAPIRRGSNVGGGDDPSTLVGGGDVDLGELIEQPRKRTLLPE
jgi:hypothetical protein